MLVPNISDLDAGLKLALTGIFQYTVVLISYLGIIVQCISTTGAIKDTVVGEERLGRFLLAFLNSRQAPLKWKKSIEEARAKEEAEKKVYLEKTKPKTLLELKKQAYLAQKQQHKKEKRVTDHNKVYLFGYICISYK